MIKGETVELMIRTASGTDEFNAPVYEESWVSVEDVLIGEPSSEDAAEIMNLFQKHVSYTLAVPKGDTHEWTNTKVRFWGHTFQTIGQPTRGIEANIPGRWNAKVQVEFYE